MDDVDDKGHDDNSGVLLKKKRPDAHIFFWRKFHKYICF